MYMNDKIEDVIVSPVNSMVKDGKPAQNPRR